MGNRTEIQKDLIVVGAGMSGICAAVQAALAKISFDGVTGSFTFDPTHTPIKPVLVVNLVDGVQTDAVAVTPKLD